MPTQKKLLAALIPLPSDPRPALKILEDDVCLLFQRQKTRKAPGPDGVFPSYLKVCANQLASIFKRSLELCEVPSCFKCSTVILISKKSTKGLNDYKQAAGEH